MPGCSCSVREPRCPLCRFVVSCIPSWFWGPVVTLEDCLAAFFAADELKGELCSVGLTAQAREGCWRSALEVLCALSCSLLSPLALQGTICTAVSAARSESAPPGLGSAPAPSPLLPDIGPGHYPAKGHGPSALPCAELCSERSLGTGGRGAGGEERQKDVTGDEAWQGKLQCCAPWAVLLQPGSAAAVFLWHCTASKAQPCPLPSLCRPSALGSLSWFLSPPGCGMESNTARCCGCQR